VLTFSNLNQNSEKNKSAPEKQFGALRKKTWLFFLKARSDKGTAQRRRGSYFNVFRTMLAAFVYRQLAPEAKPDQLMFRMTALRQKRTLGRETAGSALPPGTDMVSQAGDVRKVRGA
jgi:hypothetical protein